MEGRLPRNCCLVDPLEAQFALAETEEDQGDHEENKFEWRCDFHFRQLALVLTSDAVRWR